jgi:hypothetical protein
MAGENGTFTLVGKFDDQITPSLKKLNKTFAALERSINRGMTRSFKGLSSETRSFAKELDSLGKVFNRKSNRGIDGLKDGIKAANSEANILGRNLRNAMEAGSAGSAGLKDGIKAAQGEARVLGDILKANALVKVGEGFSNALTAGATSAVNILQRGMGFAGGQFKAAVADQMEDLQARGSLYGSLRKQGVLTGKSAEEQTQDYRQTKVISRANEQAIGQLIRTSSVSTSVVTTLNRQLTDNLLPTLLKAKGYTNLSGKSREELDAIFGGEKGIGTDLARLYEQMATVLPSPEYAKQGAMGFTQAITSGTINRQLSIFENNPVLVDALKTIDGGIQGTADIGKRIQILRKALEVAAPTMMLDEMKNTIAGGMQAVQDTIMNPTVGILSLGADIANEGKKTLQQYKDSGAYQLKLERTKANIRKAADKMELTGLKRKEYIAKQEKEAIEKLNDALESADSPIEKISVSLAPVLQSFAGLLNTFGNLFIGPVTSIMNALYKPLAQLELTFDRLSTDVEAGKRSIGDALGRAIGEFFKAIASYFNPEKAGKEIGGGIEKFFADFKKGFESIDGSKYLKQVMDSLGTILMKMLFNEGDVTKGMTPLGDGLGKVFLALSAPAFINALIMGLVPLAVQGMGSMMLKVFTGLGPKIVAGQAAKNAAAAATAAKAAQAAKAASVSSMALGAAPVAATAGATGAASGLSAIPVLGWISALTAAFVIFEKPIMAFSASLRNMGQKMQKSEDWLTSSMGHVLDGIMQLVQGVTKFFNGLWEIVSGLLMGDTDRVVNGIKKLFSGVADAFVGILRSIGGLGGVITTAVGNVFKAVAGVLDRAADWLAKKTFGDKPENKRFNPFTGQLSLVNPDPKGGGRAGYETRNGVKGWRSTSGEWTALAKGSGSPFTGNLGQAINYEMKNKPSGSDLVIANSSETIIPAAGGLNGGVAGVIDAVWRSSQGIAQTFLRGFDTLIKTTAAGDATVARTTQQTGAATRASIERSTAIQMAGDAKIMSAIRAASAAGGMGGGEGGFGGMLGAGSGGLGAAAAMAKSMGLTMTSFKRSGPANASYHNVGRAMDFSNSTGPTPQMLAFAQKLAATSGSKMAELIYTPLGYSIKNGKKVAPYAQGSHYNHVHVAYAYGPGNPAFFSNQGSAMAWEKQMMPGGARVRSVTSNSSESLGGTSVGNINVTVNAGHTDDPDKLATIVAQRLSQAIQEVRSASVFV